MRTYILDGSEGFLIYVGYIGVTFNDATNLYANHFGTEAKLDHFVRAETTYPNIVYSSLMRPSRNAKEKKK